MLASFLLGCAATRSPLPPGVGIEVMPEIPILPETGPAPPVPSPKETRTDTATSSLSLEEVLATLETNFPLIGAVEQERAIAAGLRLSAEGNFDTTLRARGASREGTYENSTLDFVAEQPVPFHGMNFFSGYRFGLGNFPVYYGNQKTATGGELRTGFLLPLLKDGPIDRRRAVLRQAQINETLADPLVQRVRIDAYRAARRAYANWLAAGELYRIAEQFAQVARTRNETIAERQKRGAANELEAAQARQTLAEREGRLAAAAGRFQQAAIDLSMLYRDGDGRRLMPTAARLPNTPPPPETLPDDPHMLERAWTQRPESRRFLMQKERAAVDLALARNQMEAGLNLGMAVAQDVGYAKNEPGIFALDRTFAEAFVTFDLPVQRRDARGKAFAAQAALNQLLKQEQYAKDSVATEVQTARTLLEQNLARLEKARVELKNADEVARIAREQYPGAIRLFELNNLEVIALDAQSKVVEILAEYHRAWADYQAALGFDR